MTSRSLASLIGFLALVVAGASSAAQNEGSDAAPILMSPEWAEATCQAWNDSATLTQELATWIENDADRGYKILQIYRTDCAESPWVELRIAEENGEARCSYGGSITADEVLDLDADYVMHAMTERWVQMGEGAYGPMKAMMFGRLKFNGPMWEAMKNMGPFGGFLQLVGAVESDATTCPEAAVATPATDDAPGNT